MDRIWKTGDEVNLAIGQGDLLVTPLQLATAFAAIANGDAGKTDSQGNVQLNVLVPHVGLQITDAAGNIVHEFETQTRKTVSMTPHDLGLIRTGLQYVTSENRRGPRYAAFKGFPIPVVGKTGTSQKTPDARTTPGSWATRPPTTRRSWWSRSSSRAGTAARWRRRSSGG